MGDTNNVSNDITKLIDLTGLQTYTLHVEQKNVQCTLAQYNSLPSTKLTDGKTYFITDKGYTIKNGVNYGDGGASANVQSDWNVTDTTSDAFIKNKPTALSSFTNDCGFITNAVNDLTNYYKKTETYTKSEVDSLIELIPTFSIEVVDTLLIPDPSPTTIYLLLNTSTTSMNLYTEYIYIIPETGEPYFEKLGEQTINLSDYYTSTEVDTLLNGKVNTSDVGQAAAKDVDTSISNGSTSSKLPTSSAVASFVEGKGYVTTDTTYTLSAGTGSDAQKVILTPSSGSAQKVTVPYATSAGDAATVNGKTVAKSVPADAVFTDTTYENATTTTAGLMSTTDKGKVDALGTAATKDVATSGNASTSQVVMGNDTRLSDARPASDVSAWAKAASKPSYTASEVGLGNVTNDKQIKGLASGTTENHVVTFGTDGYTVKDSGFTIGKSVPSDAVFTDNNTTYSFTNGTNGFTVTPSGGTAQTVTVTPSIANASTASAGLMSAADKIKIDGLGTASTKNVPATGNATSSQVVMGNDTRLTDARTPVSHTHTKSEITDFPTSLPASNTTDTYSATGTNPVSGKAVAAALGTLDVTGASSIGAGKTISAWSETDGKVSISTQNISITKSQVSDFPTLGTAAAKNYTTSVTNGSSDLVTSGAVYTAIDNLPEPMVFKGSLGTGGTITALPVNGTASIGDTYKVITAGTYASQAAKVGDTFICDSKTSSANTWVLIPSGDEPSGTVTSVAIANGGAMSISGSPITSSGTITISHADTSSQASVNNSGRTYIQDITLDTYGHVTGIASATETVTNTDRYVNSASFDHDSTNDNVKMTLTRAGSDTATVTGNIPKVSSSSAGVAPKGAAVSTQSQSTKFLREDGTWAKPSYTTNTNTTYTFANGTNGFTVTPSGGSAQTVTVTPSITNNVTGSGTSGYIAKWNGANTVTNGPAFGSATTTYLRNDGTWQTPTDTKNTAGSTDTSSKIFLVGATSQATNPQTYSDNEIYATSGVLTTKSVQVGGTAATIQYNSTNKCIDFVFA